MEEPPSPIAVEKKVDAVAAAEHKLEEMEEGGLMFSSLPPDRRRFLEAVHREATLDDESAILKFISSRQNSCEIVDCVSQFMAFKIKEKGEETRHLGNLRRVLTPMSKSFSGKAVTDVSSKELQDWWKDRVIEKKPKTCNEIRTNLVSFWNWCIWMGFYPKEVTPAERLPKSTVETQERRVIVPDEFLDMAHEIQREYRSSIILQAFCAFRPEEVAPPTRKGMSKKSKRGILREEIDWDDCVIRIPAQVSKTGFPRIVPLLPCARAWLEWAGVHPGQTGPVCPINLVEAGETFRLGSVVFKTGWPQDALRHSYGSYRNAIVRSLPQVAEEMGSSVSMLERHYHNPRSQSEGEAWFALRPLDLTLKRFR